MTLRQQLYELGYLSHLDFHVAELLGPLAPRRDEQVLLALSLTHRATGHGHICLPLQGLESLYVQRGEQELEIQLPPTKEWINALKQSPLVGPDLPLFLDDRSRLYLGKYYAYERKLVQEVQNRLQYERVQTEELFPLLQYYFPQGDRQDLQRLAAINALHHRFSVITGGPGTGKTTTVAKLLGIYIESALKKGKKPHITLLAPTGKAAGQMTRSLTQAREQLNYPPEVLPYLPAKATTLHRALKVDRNHPSSFKKNRHNPLVTDLVVIDEASMIDLPLWTKLLDAIPPTSKVIFLGDRDQLASVEAGAILGDLCNPARYGGQSQEQLRDYAALNAPPAKESNPRQRGFYDCITHLDFSRRFDPTQGIGRLATAIRKGDVAEVFRALEEEEQVEWIQPTQQQGLSKLFFPLIEQALSPYLKTQTPQEALAASENFALLCAHRVGFLGADWANEVIEADLQNKGLLDSSGSWYRLRPLMIRANDSRQDLFNGDVGCVFPDYRLSHAPPMAWFAQGEELKPRSPSLLPPHQTNFAMTVHKSQGSEFKEVFLLLPANPSHVLNRELIYTAVTRAKSKFWVLGSKEVLSAAIRTRIQRDSGLKDHFWG